MNGFLQRVRYAAARDWHLELAALGGMALGSLVDTARLGPLGIQEICGDPRAGLLARVDAHGFSYGLMLAAMALAALAGARSASRQSATGRTALHALAMCAGMAAADLATPLLPGTPTLWFAFLMMALGMAAGSLAARCLAGDLRRPSTHNQDAQNRGRRWD